MLTGTDLIGDINGCTVGPDELAIWWLGQHGFVLKIGPTVVYLDAYLSPSAARRVPPLLEGPQVVNADVVCGSHDHGDHIDRRAWPAIAAASPRAVFVVPLAHRRKLLDALALPEERLVGLDDGQSADVAGVRITGIAAAHELLERDDLSGAHRHLGYLLQAGGWTVYHSGDTCMYEGLVSRLKAFRPDIAFLPINGRDAARLARGCIGNMTYQEAADLAGAIAPALTVPGHYEMFADNAQDPQPFLDYMRVKYPALATTTLEHGRRFLWARRRRA